MEKVISKDGTTIAFDKIGNGPVLIIVASALADRQGAAQLANRLSERFTVINYDRRGRGDSSDQSPYAVAREVEDIEVLIDANGGSSALFGSSSGAALALEAANLLGEKVSRMFLYEPPFIVNDDRPPVPTEYVAHLNQLISEGKRSEAVEYFMTAAAGVPEEFVGFMKADPSWGGMEALAHTLPYDGTVMGTTQQGNPLPSDKWSINVPVAVIAGENSGAFFHAAAKEVSSILPKGEYSVLPGQDHAAAVMAPDELAAAIVGLI
ncbi:alpha/beta fold hydrolase [Paenibacillus sp. GCM10027627]|uniref:alpha/beta fold hydrolase n=1 Tax=unclassified Paenibacillus TaxID=185978 RepID=UPI0036277A24